MKATDLMAEDWVERTHHTFEGRVVNRAEQVTAFDIYRNAEFCYPIPLSAEALEKNGFERNPHKNSHFYFDDGFVEVDIHEITEGVWLVEVDNLVISMPTQRIIVCNVHELQHALRLCGIEKEIKL